MDAHKHYIYIKIVKSFKKAGPRINFVVYIYILVKGKVLIDWRITNSPISCFGVTYHLKWHRFHFEFPPTWDISIENALAHGGGVILERLSLTSCRVSSCFCFPYLKWKSPWELLTEELFRSGRANYSQSFATFKTGSCLKWFQVLMPEVKYFT